MSETGQEPPPGDGERLRRLLGGEDLAWLVERARRRMAQGQPPAGVVTLARATPEQRRAADRLLGRRAGRGASLSVSLDDVDRTVRASGAAPGGLAQAVVALTGPVVDEAAAQAALAAAWEAARAPLAALAARRGELEPWLAWLDTTGMLRRLADGPAAAEALAGQAVAVLDALPSPGMALGRLAASAAGDAHALDDGRSLATLALAAARVLAGGPPTGDGSAAARRAAWAAVGVHADELSSTVLRLGLPGGAGSPAARLLAVAHEAGEPCVLTLRQVTGRGGTPGALGVGGGVVFVCENPVVLGAAADEFGVAAPPVVCVNGQPSAAVLGLLGLLVGQGATLAYHGDFDWGGLRIAAGLAARVPWRAWRFDTRAYEAALSTVGGGPLTGRPADAPWDPALRGALERHAIRIDEELVLPDLLADLGARAGRPGARARR